MRGTGGPSTACWWSAAQAECNARDLERFSQASKLGQPIMGPNYDKRFAQVCRVVADSFGMPAQTAAGMAVRNDRR